MTPEKAKALAAYALEFGDVPEFLQSPLWSAAEVRTFHANREFAERNNMNWDERETALRICYSALHAAPQSVDTTDKP